jgi:subtilisin family serine protease
MTDRTSFSDDYTYVDKSSGRRIAFTAKADEAMVRFRRTRDRDAARAVLADSPVLSVSEGINPQLGFAAVHVDAAGDVSAMARSLEAAPQITHSMPVMIDENGASRFFVPDEITVQFRPDIDDARARELIDRLGSRVVVAQRTPGYYTVAVPAGKGMFDTIRKFAVLPEVAFAEPSEVSFNSALAYFPDDPEFGRLWGLHNTGQTVNNVAGTADADIDAPEAWDVTRGHPDVIVAVIDSGADMDHRDLAANILARGAEDWDFADAGDPVPEDEHSLFHGTHVCGTVAAVDNNTGVIGVAPGCRLMPLRIDLTTGMNQNRADAINYTTAQALAHPGRRYVINCSWRMNGDHAGVRTAIQNAVNNNVVVVYAAGNDNVNTDTSPQFPGVYPEVIAVAALDQQNRKAGFSNFGTNVDVAAPGVNIWSTTGNGTRGFLDGTSMASPHVAGLAALIWSRNRCLTNHQVRQIIEDSCDSVDAANPGFVGLLGAGRINAFRAVQQAAAGPTILSGTHTLQQRSSSRFVDAHEHAGEDFRLVTREAQNDDTQRWVLTPIGLVCTLRQTSSGRFVDAHEIVGEDFRLVTRAAQSNDTQRWVLMPVPGQLSTYTMQQLSNGRFVDAHEHAGEDFRLVTREAQHNDTQRWIFSDIGGCAYTIRQRSSGRFVDAHEHAGEDFRLVTREAQNNDTQRWMVSTVGHVCTIQQLSSGRFVDAHEHAGEDFRLVTRTAQLNDTQKWAAIRVGRATYTLQQLSNGRLVDAHEHAGEDFRLVSRTAQLDDTQRWIIRPVGASILLAGSVREAALASAG